jgi:hypothetical protein
MASVRIYKPPKSAMQSARGNMNHWLLEFEPGARQQVDTLMGWVGAGDTREQVRMKFDTREEAIAFAERNDLSYRVIEPKDRKVLGKSYADNFILSLRQRKNI